MIFLLNSLFLENEKKNQKNEANLFKHMSNGYNDIKFEIKKIKLWGLGAHHKQNREIDILEICDIFCLI